MASPRIELVTRRDRIKVKDVAQIFMHAGWTKDRRPLRIWRMLRHTDILVLARYKGRPVGFARVLTDRTFRAFVEDVIVVPALRRRGIGRAMMVKAEQLVKKLGVLRMELTSTETGFWEELGYGRKTNTSYMVKYLNRT